MPTPAGEPLRKVTLNLFESDCAYLEEIFGHGWSTIVRDQTHEYVTGHTSENRRTRRTLGDLE